MEPSFSWRSATARRQSRTIRTKQNVILSILYYTATITSLTRSLVLLSKMNRLASPICKLLKDPNKQVRYYALSILIELYKQVGDQLRDDLLQDEDIPIERLQTLFERFDEVKNSQTYRPLTRQPSRLKYGQLYEQSIYFLLPVLFLCFQQEK
ncbi:hypothetical protein ACOME3_003546 [Neoechinorhynchus agilis]